MTLHRDMFITYYFTAGEEVCLGNNDRCKVAGVGAVRLSMKDDVVSELAGARHVPDIMRNVVSIGVLEVIRYEFSTHG